MILVSYETMKNLRGEFAVKLNWSKEPIGTEYRSDSYLVGEQQMFFALITWAEDQLTGVPVIDNDFPVPPLVCLHQTKDWGEGHPGA